MVSKRSEEVNMKSEVFKKELEYIKDEKIKESTVYILDKLPDYFYHIAASSTGKYHPEFSLGEMGLVRHVKVAVRIAEELFNNPSLCNFNEHEKDLIRMAIILHDGLKKGIKEEKYTLFDHPIIMANFLEENKDNLSISKEDVDDVIRMIKSHMGPWNVDNYTGKELPIPKNKDERFVHMCDYLSSRKFLNVKFNNNDIEL